MRFVVIIGLLLTLVVLARGALQSWKEIEIPPMPEIGDNKKATSLAERQPLELNPQVPVLMPDLHAGYLFNQQRLLAESAEEESPAGDSMGEEASIPVNMDTLTYSGSIIIGNVRKGMVSFSTGETGTPALQSRRRTPPRAVTGKLEYKTVSEGEAFYDFVVAQILPDKIVFSRGGATVEKLLYDPQKERKKVARTMTPGSRVPLPGQPRRAVPGQPRRAVPGQPAPSVQPSPPVTIGEQPDTGQPEAAKGPSTPTQQLNPGARPSLPSRTVRRPRVIQRRRLPVQSR
jgi:hypothetical protein